MSALTAEARFAPLLREQRRRGILRGVTFLVGLAGATLLAAEVAGFEPGRLLAGVHRLGEFLGLLAPPVTAGNFAEDMAEWYWNLGHWMKLLLDTLLMAALATALGTMGGALMSIPASRNLTPGPRIYWITRRILEFARAVPDLVFAIIFVFAFGLGPLAGMLAIALHSLGAQGKLFAEANENADMAPVMGVRAAGGARSEEILWAVVPQVLPNWVSFTFWRFEINVRSATIIGFVGAGGIGTELYDALRLNYYDDTGAILLLVAVTVFLIDDVSERLRLRIAGHAGQSARTRMPGFAPGATPRERLESLLRAGRPNPWPARIVWAAFALILIYAAIAFGLIGSQFLNGLPRLWGAIAMMFPPEGWEHVPEFLWALAETIAMGLLGTLIGALIAFPLALLCARTTLPLRVLQFGFRRLADSLRSLDHLIWAIVFVRAVGLGPLAGVLAIAVVDIGNLAKLYSEAIDNAQRGAPEGVKATGGAPAENFRWGVLPQVLPNIASATLYMWESNTRSATILGIVGAGGIGYQLADRLRVYEWGQASLIILMILVTVYGIDMISAWLRRRLIEGR